MTGCKYCDPSDGMPETLLAPKDGSMEIVIRRHPGGASIVATEKRDGMRITTARMIDYCPMCGTSLRAFGPAWAAAVER